MTRRRASRPDAPGAFQFESESLGATWLSGPPLRRRFQEDLEGCRASLAGMTADLKRAQMGRRQNLVDLLLTKCRQGVRMKLLVSSTTWPLREALAAGGAADLPLLEIRQCPRNHAKAVWIDDRVFYAGSGNLTGKGLGAMASADSMNVELMVRLAGEEALAPARAVAQNVFDPVWEGALCGACLWKRRGRCDGLLDKYAILDLGPA